MSTNLQQKQTTPYVQLKIVHRGNENKRIECFNPSGIKYVDNFSTQHINCLRTIVEELRRLQVGGEKQDFELLATHIDQVATILSEYCTFKEYSSEFNKLGEFILKKTKFYAIK